MHYEINFIYRIDVEFLRSVTVETNIYPLEIFGYIRKEKKSDWIWKNVCWHFMSFLSDTLKAINNFDQFKVLYTYWHIYLSINKFRSNHVCCAIINVRVFIECHSYLISNILYFDMSSV